MTEHRIRFVYDENNHPETLSREGRYKPFLSALEYRWGSRAETIKGKLSEVAPEDGFIIYAGVPIELSLNGCSESALSSIAPRIVAIDVNTPHLLERVLEPFSLAGVIDTLSFIAWQQDAASQIGATGLFGRSAYAPGLGAKCIAFSSERYCCFTSKEHIGLPHLLSDYLRALALTETKA